MKSMLSTEEKQYLVWLTHRMFEGWGSIVDLGPWLGSSSAALAEGLRRHGKHDKVVSFDLFQWDRAYMEPLTHETLEDGGDFLPLFMREIGEYSHWIEPRKQDLMRYSWDGGPIEILFVDAAKTWELANAILSGFGEHLVSGRSRVILQDFRYHYTHWLPLIFESRPDVWREVENVEVGTTVTFVPLKPLHGPAGIHTDYSEEGFPLSSVEHILRNRMVRETTANRHLLLRMLYRKYLLEGSAAAIASVRNELLQSAGASLTVETLASIEDISDILVPQGWKAYDRGEYGIARATAERCLADEKRRPVYAVVLLGLASLRLGETGTARACIDEVIARRPGLLHGRLYRAEVALAERRYQEAKEDAVMVLQRATDEMTIGYALGILTQALRQGDSAARIADVLSTFDGSLGSSPSYLVHLAQEQFQIGDKESAIASVTKALELAPEHPMAAELRGKWSSMATGEEDPPPASHPSR